MRLALLLPDGVGVRNFLLGGFVGEASKAGPVTILHAIPDELLERFRAGSPVAEWHRLVPMRGGRLETALRSTLSYAHMYQVQTTAMRRRLARRVSTASMNAWALVHGTRLLGRAAASPAGITFLEEWRDRVVERVPAVSHYRQLFQRTRPEVLFCSHQRPPEIAAPVIAARGLAIPTATFIFSWDNLCSKGRMGARFDHYLVWSHHMAAELHQHYPGIAANRVHVVGTPQFDPYADLGVLWTREEFCRRIGADPARPLICYSGGDRGTCPDDEKHLRLLLEMIRTGQIVGRPSVVLRPSPVDDGKRYDGVRRDFPELLYAPPAWVHPVGSTWADVIPLPEDVPFLANLTYHSALNVNTASTMTLDFAARDKPVVNLAFDVTSPPPLGVPLDQMYYQYEHYRPVSDFGAARIARSPAELAGYVNDYLADPTLDRDGRRRLLELELELPLGDARGRVLAVLQDIARGSRNGSTSDVCNSGLRGSRARV